MWESKQKDRASTCLASAGSACFRQRKCSLVPEHFCHWLKMHLVTILVLQIFFDKHVDFRLGAFEFQLHSKMWKTAEAEQWGRAEEEKGLARIVETLEIRSLHSHLNKNLLRFMALSPSQHSPPFRVPCSAFSPQFASWFCTDTVFSWFCLYHTLGAMESPVWFFGGPPFCTFHLILVL